MPRIGPLELIILLVLFGVVAAVVIAVTAARPKRVTPEARQETAMYCTHCGKQLSTGTRFCDGCGTPVAAATAPQPVQQPAAVPAAAMPRKDPAIAALLAALPGFFSIWGIGHMYAGQVGKGVVWLIVGLLLGVLGFIFAITIIGLIIAVPIWIAGFIIWIVLIFSAHSAAKEYNREVERTGRAPW